MSKTDFAELKEKLTKFDGHKSQASMPRLYEHIDRVDLWITAQQKQHTKSAAIISELIEIIEMQSEALEFYADPFTYTENEYGEKKIDYYRTYEKGEDSLSETTTRLQKLREGK